MSVQKIASVLGVRPQETSQVLTLVISSFFLGAALVLYYTASNSIFLSAFDIKTLPYMYIANAGLTIIFGFVYAAIQKRAPLGRLLYITNAILAGIVILCWLALLLTTNPAAPFTAMTLFRLMFIFTTLGLWELASAAFNVQQAKRLFSLIGLGLMSAFIAGGLLTPLLVRVVGVANILLLSAVCLLVYTAILMRMVPRMEIKSVDQVQQAGQLSVVEMLKDPYVRLIFGLKTCSMLVAYVVEYIFYQQAAANFHGPRELANFLGIFTGSATLITVLIAGLVAGRYISRFGVRVALPTMPAAMALTSLASALYGRLVGPGGIFFGLVSSMMYVNQVLEKSIYTPTAAVLYQPLAPARRMPVRVAVEGWFGSAALVISGGLLLLFGRLPVRTIVPFIYLLIAISSTFFLLTLWVYRAYIVQLGQAVKARFVSGVALPDDSIRDADALADYLHSDHPAKTLATLYYLETAEGNPAMPFLVDLLDHPSQDVKLDVLARIADSHFLPARDAVARLVDDSSQPKPVRGQALVAWMALEGEAAFGFAEKHLSGELSEYALIGLLAYGGERGSGRAATQLDSLARSADPAQRSAAARVLAQTERGDFTGLLTGLLHDSDVSVRQTAAQAASVRFDPAMLDDLLALLSDKMSRPAVRRALARGGDAGAAALAQRYAGLSPLLQCEVITALGQNGSPSAVAFLETRLQNDPPPELYHAVLKALHRAGFLMQDHAGLAGLLAREQTVAAWVLGAQQADVDGLLHRALDAEFIAARQRACWVLGFMDETLHDIERSLDHPNRERSANALELIEVSTPPDLRRLLAVVVGDLPVEKRLQVCADIELPDESHWEVAISENDALFNAWTRGCARHLVNIQNETAEVPVLTLIEKVILLRSVGIFGRTPDPVLAEVAEHLEELRLEAGETFIHTGETDDRLYLIVSGSVRVHDGDVTIRTLGAGDIVGELALLDPAPRAAMVTTLSSSHFFIIDQNTFYDLVDARPEIIHGVVRVLAGRVRAQGEMLTSG